MTALLLAQRFANDERLSVRARRMSDAVEGAEVILYGVSKRYKESANCRLEANYAHQQE